MIVPIGPEKGFAIVAKTPSPRQRFEKRAEEIARAAELHVRRMVEEEAALLSVAPPRWAVDPECRDTVPFGLKRRVVLRVPVFARPKTDPDESIRELATIRSLMARLALDLIEQVVEINRYFAAAGLVPPPEREVSPAAANQDPEGASAGKTMSGGSAGSSFRRRA